MYFNGTLPFWSLGNGLLGLYLAALASAARLDSRRRSSSIFLASSFFLVSSARLRSISSRFLRSSSWRLSSSSCRLCSSKIDWLLKWPRILRAIIEEKFIHKQELIKIAFLLMYLHLSKACLHKQHQNYLKIPSKLHQIYNLTFGIHVICCPVITIMQNARLNSVESTDTSCGLRASCSIRVSSALASYDVETTSNAFLWINMLVMMVVLPDLMQ